MKKWKLNGVVDPKWYKAQGTKLRLNFKKKRVLLQRQLRKVVTGNEEKRIRDLIREKRKQPPILMLIDKLFFTFGVLILAMSEYILLMFPRQFGNWYACVIILMLIFRWFYYRTLKWTYFMIDFCYFTQLTCLATLVMPASWALKTCLMRVNFLYANGPLAFAVPCWRNSLVFHDMDKVTSTYIHVFPMWLLYSQRWFWEEFACTTCNASQSLGFNDLLIATGGYCGWQLLYYLKTEILDKKKFESDPSIQTSLRWLSSDQKNVMHVGVLYIMRASRIMGTNEAFDPCSLKTKVIFMGSQLVYTLISFLPCFLMYNHFVCNTAYGLLISTWAIWNGAVYYIEVFSSRYMKKFENILKNTQEKESKKD